MMNVKTIIKRYDLLPLHIVEDHNDVVPFIHRAIGSKHLPMTDIVFVHFDSHPDLLIPGDLRADDIYDKDRLYSCCSIENWILPMVYAGHISDVIWLKPPWCRQIEDKTIQFYVGKCTTTELIRTSCKESYFVSETLFKPCDQLINKKLITLSVVTVQPDDWLKFPKSTNEFSSYNKSVDDKEKSAANEADDVLNKDLAQNSSHCLQKDSSTLQKSGTKEDDTSEDSKTGIHKNETDETVLGISSSGSTSAGEPANKKQCMVEHSNFKDEIQQKLCGDAELNEQDGNNITESCSKCLGEIFDKFNDRHFVLDIDLDFFSTKNPFRELYTPSQYQLIKELYTFDKPSDDSDQGIQKCVEKREIQLKCLKEVFMELKENPQKQIVHESNENKKSERKKKSINIEKLIADLKSTAGVDEIDFELLHEAGCTCDDTELPHHVSNQEEITLLIDAVQEVLSHIPKPTMITMARSSNDDYCPPDQVDDIQEKVLEMLQDLYLSINMSVHYTTVSV